jgi:hypothetical protein
MAQFHQTTDEPWAGKAVGNKQSETPANPPLVSAVTGLLQQYPVPADLNFQIGDRISCALTALLPMAVWMALRYGSRWAWAPFAVLSSIAALNTGLFRYLAKAVGWGTALRCFPLLLAHLATRCAGLVAGLAKAEHRRDQLLWPVCALIGLILLAVQIGGGAFTAEFTGHPDEPAQFVSGLAMYDYITSLPAGNPLAWAGNYYLHYPKVAIGHWPPAYHFAEALWWLLWGPSRASAMGLQWITGVAAMTLLYRFCRAVLPLPIALGIVGLTIAAPVFQESLEQAMADLGCLLWSVLFMQVATRCLDVRDRPPILMLGMSLMMAAITKGTAACLVPVAIAVLLASRRCIRISTAAAVTACAGVCAVAAWYAMAGNALAWAGIAGHEPWPGALIGNMAGWGFLALGVLGVRRLPAAMVAAGIVISVLGCSLALRAMREDRHWIIVLPAILVLAGFAVDRFRHRPALAALVLIPALLGFPWLQVRQTQSEFGELLRQMHLPSRMLVSSSGVGEGAWIAQASLAEKRPASYIVRASKILAEEGWSGENYRLLTVNAEAVLRRIDELALDVVIIEDLPAANPPLHQVLLHDAVRHSSAWKECAQARNLVAYCRVRAPEFPRRPLEMRIQGMDLKEITK